MVRRLILWDIDGTLVRVGELGAKVFDLALEEVFGRRPTSRVLMGGKTDPQIVREYLALMKVQADDGHVPAVLRHLEVGLAAAAGEMAESGRACPGVTQVLAALAADPGVAQSVLTGNIAPNAILKLSAFGLDRWLDLEIGAYGSDDEDRLVLVPVALRRAAELRHARLDPGDVWVVGDTPRDLACARAAGAHCLLVATGRLSADDLRGLGADAVLDDLTDTAAVVALLTS